jgi:hypothetical protein
VSDQVDGGLGDGGSGAYDVIAGGVQCDGEAESVGTDSGAGQGGVGQCGAQRLVGDQ